MGIHARQGMADMGTIVLDEIPTEHRIDILNLSAALDSVEKITAQILNERTPVQRFRDEGLHKTEVHQGGETEGGRQQ